MLALSCARSGVRVASIIQLYAFGIVETAEGQRRCAIVAPQAVKIEIVNHLEVWRKTGVLLRVTRDYARRNRMLNAAYKATAATARSFGHIAHVLWLEVTGTVFLAMAVFGAGAFVHEYIKFHAGRATAGRLAIAVCFTLTFGWFGLSSFWRVMRKNGSAIR